MRNFYSQDGEAEILIPAMTEIVQSGFEEANTDFIKGAPSATGIHQANDRNDSFKDTKAGMASVTRNQVDCSNPTLASHVRAAINELKETFPIAIVTSANVAKIVHAVEALTYVQKNGSVQARKHVESYRVRWNVIHQHIFLQQFIDHRNLSTYIRRFVVSTSLLLQPARRGKSWGTRSPLSA